MDFLLGYNYPGNVRELKNIVERMIALSKDGRLTINEMLMPIGNSDRKKNSPIESVQSLKDARSNFEQDYIVAALKKNSGNVAKTADNLGISTRQLWNKINQYEINPKNRA